MTELVSIYAPRLTAKPGENTAKLFEQLPLPVKEKLEVVSLRNAVAEWDAEQAFPYPENISSSSFVEENINNVPVSIYRDSGGNRFTPTVLLIHGGGFFCELANVHKSLMANIIGKIPCHGILPHYSLAPENKAPKAINEITSLLQELLAYPEKYGVTENIVIIGYSSGANLALNAVLNILNSPETQKLAAKIGHLFLMSPWVDLSVETTKSNLYQHQQDRDKMLQAWGLEQMRDWYLPEDANGKEPLYSPVYCPVSNMKGMPNTTVIVGEIDRLLTDAVKITSVLKNAGTTVQLVVLEGQSHNHSCHADLRDGVFTPDIISRIMRNESVENLRGADGLGVVILGEIPNVI